jgi:hypothetical protein
MARPLSKYVQDLESKKMYTHAHTHAHACTRTHT